MLAFMEFQALVEAQDIARGDLVDDFRRREPVHLILKNMAKAFLLVGERFFHFLALEEPLHDLRDIEPGLHVKVNESLVRLVEAAGVLQLQHIHHFLDDVLRRENLVRLLRRNVVEDILHALLVEVIRQLLYGNKLIPKLSL